MSSITLVRAGRTSLLIACASAALALAAALPSSAAAATPASQFPYCSWWLTTTPQTANVAFPDAAATYWTTPFLVEPGLRIAVDGTYPDARYMSFNVYDSSFGTFSRNGVSSGLADYLIAPASGSLNPFQATGQPGGAFTLTLREGVRPGQRNTLPLAPHRRRGGGSRRQLGFLVYRTYLPTGGYGTVDLPTLTLVRGTRRVQLPRCPARGRSAAFARPRGVPRTPAVEAATRALARRLRSGGGTSPCRGSACPPALQFFRAKAATTNAFFPNVDNAYVSALVRPAGDSIVVVRGRAPASPDGTHPAPWPQSGLQLRYWSLCNNIYRRPWPVVANPQPGGGVEYGCAFDDATTLGADGGYAFVVGRTDQQAAIEAAGGTFVPWSQTQPHARQVLILRNMLPNASFTNAVQNVPQDGNPASAAQAMGDYYPRAYRCTVSQLTAGDPACGG